jgi:hypothetical protein
VPVPSSNVLSTYDQAFGLTDKNENGGISNEHGFAVGITEDGILVSSAIKTDENPRAVTLAEAISELEAKGIEVLYVVHTHGNNYTEIDGQISAPEHFPSVGPTDDTGNQGRRLDNGLVVHSSVVLGWETTKYETTIQVNNGILTEDRVVSEVKQRKMITWYSRDEADQFDMDYVEYRKVLQKIFKKNEKQNKE